MAFEELLFNELLKKTYICLSGYENPDFKWITSWQIVFSPPCQLDFLKCPKMLEIYVTWILHLRWQTCTIGVQDGYACGYAPGYGLMQSQQSFRFCQHVMLVESTFDLKLGFWRFFMYFIRESTPPCLACCWAATCFCPANSGSPATFLGMINPPASSYSRLIWRLIFSGKFLFSSHILDDFWQKLIVF